MHLARLLLLVPALAAAALAAGCGPSDDSGGGDPAADRAPSAPPGATARSCPDSPPGTEELRVTEVGCDAGEAVAAAWAGDPNCSSPAGESRFTCAVRGYRCLGAATDRGIAVSCARPNRSIAFVARRG